jgi:hypothetical protein
MIQNSTWWHNISIVQSYGAGAQVSAFVADNFEAESGEKSQ